jgi:predicted nucleotidyltransferase
MRERNFSIIKELKDMLLKKFTFISEVILFGSQASGKTPDSSDYDILIIVNQDISWRQQREVVDEVYSIDLKYNILTDVKIISQTQLRTLRGKQPFIQNALKEGIAA